MCTGETAGFVAQRVDVPGLAVDLGQAVAAAGVGKRFQGCVGGAQQQPLVALPQLACQFFFVFMFEFDRLGAQHDVFGFGRVQRVGVESAVGQGQQKVRGLGHFRVEQFGEFIARVAVADGPRHRPDQRGGGQQGGQQDAAQGVVHGCSCGVSMM